MKLFNLKKFIKPKSDEKTYIENEHFDTDFDDEDEKYITIQEGGIYDEPEQKTFNQNKKEKHSLDWFLEEAMEYSKSKSKESYSNNDDFNLLDR